MVKGSNLKSSGLKSRAEGKNPVGEVIRKKLLDRQEETSKNLNKADRHKSLARDSISQV